MQVKVRERERIVATGPKILFEREREREVRDKQIRDVDKKLRSIWWNCLRAQGISLRIVLKERVHSIIIF